MSSSLTSALVNDPIFGHVYAKMMNGGSWFDADQEFWAIQYDQTVLSLTSLLAGKPTKANVEKAAAFLSVLDACSLNLVSSPKSLEALKARVKAWTPAPSSGPRPPVRSSFALLAESDDE